MLQLRLSGLKIKLERLRWFAHVQWTDSGYIGQKMLKMKPAGSRKRGRLQTKFMAVAKGRHAERWV